MKADYGVYGSWSYYISLAILSAIFLLLAIFIEFFRLLFATAFGITTAVLVLFVLVPQILYARKRGWITRRVVEAGRISEGDSVLDIGTGRGFLAIEIAKAVKGSRAVGVDIWEIPAEGEMHQGFVLGNTRENAERNAQLEGVYDRVEFKRADAREMPFESESFDVVVSSIAMHQIVYSKEGLRVLDETHRVLKPNGRLVIVDVLIGKIITDKLKELRFRDLKVQNIRNLGSFSFLLKILSAVKNPSELAIRNRGEGR